MSEAAILTPVTNAPPTRVLRYLTNIFYLAYIGLLLGFSDYMGLVPVSIGGIRFYGADFLLVFIVLLIIIYGVAPLFNNTISLLLFLLMLYGILSAVLGIANGHEPRDVIGAFRRLFFYSFSFAITWRLLDSPRRTFNITRYIYIMSIPVVVLSIIRLWRGVSWHPIFTEDDLRAVSYASATVLFWVFYDNVTKLMFSKKLSTGLNHLFWLGIMGFTLLISNYRLLWILPILGIAGIFWVSSVKGFIRIGNFLKTAVIIIISVVIAILVLKGTQNERYILIEQKFVDEVLNFQFEGSFRYFVWGEAWSRLEQNWLLGTGIGDKLEYELLSTIGTWYTRISTTHNILLEVLYQTGIIGSLLFILPHLLFLIYVWRNLRKLPPDWSRLAIALLFTYLSMMGLGLFQPFLTIPSVAILLYLIMGITARTVYWGKQVNLH